MSDYKMKEADYSILNKNIKIVFISSEFNRNFTESLEEKNELFLKDNWFNNIEKFLVPWAFEIPAFLNKLLKKKEIELVICFWVVVRWKTTHYEMVAWESARWIMDISLKNTKTSIINWILTCENEKQVIERISETYALSGLNLLAETKRIW